MAQIIADKRDVEFVLFEQIGLNKDKKFKEFDKKTVELIINEARNLAIKEIYPTYKPSDEEGCKFEKGEVKVPECFHKVYKNYKDGEWLGMCDSVEYGGQGMPHLVGLAVSDYLVGANPSFMLYNILTLGAGRLVEKLGDEKQKKQCLKNLYSGKWAGTMLLTEPQAGSDLGALETKAVKNPDGTYSLTGQKIFISGGEQNLTENIIHPVLARIEGAEEGVKGISMFLVPKFKINEDGTLGEFNDVVCTGIEEKMGLHGSSTCTLALGSKGQCIGTILGKENEGLKGMFIMMNEARQVVGLQGFVVASAAYMHAINYARERIQGRTFIPENKTILGHPDVRRQLITMKSYVEGIRSLLYYNANCIDMLHCVEDPKEKEKYSDIIEVLTPIIKAYSTDKGLEVSSIGVQVLGGYGYTKEFPLEQLMRDSRIFMIYEGTNGIQAIDFIGRKLLMKEGKAFLNFINEIKKGFENAKKQEELKGLVEKSESIFNSACEIALLTAKRGKEKDSAFFTYAYPFLESFGDIVMAWMLLWRAEVALISLKSGKAKDKDFYEGKIKTAEFFVNSILPLTKAKLEIIKTANPSPVQMTDLAFASK